MICIYLPSASDCGLFLIFRNVPMAAFSVELLFLRGRTKEHLATELVRPSLLAYNVWSGLAVLLVVMPQPSIDPPPICMDPSRLITWLYCGARYRSNEGTLTVVGPSFLRWSHIA